MRQKSGKVYNWDVRVDHYLLQVNGYPEVRYIRFLENQDYSTVTDWREAHVLKGNPEFVRGFCLAIVLAIGGDITPVLRPAVQPYTRKNDTQTLEKSNTMDQHKIDAGGISLTITEENYLLFRKAYRKAIAEGKNSFMWTDRSLVLVAFGKYIIEYMETFPFIKPLIDQPDE